MATSAMPMEGGLISEVTAGQMIHAVTENTKMLRQVLDYLRSPKGLVEAVRGLTTKLDDCFDPEPAIVARAAALVRIDQRIDHVKDEKIEELKKSLAAALAAAPATPAESQ